jgi:hypothetical protein
MVTLHVYCMHFCMLGIPFDDIAQRNVGGGGPCKATFLTHAFRFFFVTCMFMDSMYQNWFYYFKININIINLIYRWFGKKVWIDS